MIPVVDVFAGPGGLNEGFSSVFRDSKPVFRTVLSIEMESSAVKTLRFRSAMRHVRSSGDNAALDKFLSGSIDRAELESDRYFAAAMELAAKEVREFTLSETSRGDSDAMISEALKEYEGKPWVLIGGPPCQAYSLAGRSRRTHDVEFQDDHKHFLYREYLNIIIKHKPAIFVMENVKGLLSSVNRGRKMIDLIKGDLRTPAPDLEYELRSMVVGKAEDELTAADFLIRSEEFGIPQKRHRIIIVGIRKGLGIKGPKLLDRADKVTVQDAIGGLPRVRSGVSRTPDHDGRLWYSIRQEALRRITKDAPSSVADSLPLTSAAQPKDVRCEDLDKSVEEYLNFVRPSEIDSFPVWNHEARRHMRSDLIRYAVMSAQAMAEKRSPKVRDLDRSLWPKHKNIDQETVPFEDRFRVQVSTEPSTTIVSHIAKDGHYYIHPDPMQMRSLTVREAARLQTFPDDYIFLGNRTQQFTQVGNAVPPLLAKKIGERIADILSSF